MAQGLDELIDRLVDEVSYYGHGCQLSDLFAALRKYNKDAEGERIPPDQEAAAALKDDPSRPDNDEIAQSSGEVAAEPTESFIKVEPTDAEVKVARLVWPFVVAVDVISVGRNDEWSHLSFDDLMSLPEEPIGEQHSARTKGTKRSKKNQQQQKQEPEADNSDPPKRAKLPRWRPRLFVPIEMVWQAITGHGVDYKRVPPLEWQALVAIGSCGEHGILQGDLGRVTGQDKRSVPRRTDFLSAKGYIAKRTHMTRGSKTSKLWLTRFAPELPALNPLHGLDLSSEGLTKDMEPVPWTHQWVDNKNRKGTEEIAYMTLGHTIMALIKAWGVLRVRDLKKKLGIVGLKWQMKVLSRMLRGFDTEGHISYVAATFVGHNFVFKDCVKFLRDPSDEEWRKLLATGKKSTHTEDTKSRMMKFKRKKRKNKLIKQTLQQTHGKKPTKRGLPKLRFLMKRNRTPPRPSLALWTPDKPLANIISEYVLTGGAEGYTAQELCRAIASSAFYHYFLNHLKNCSEPGTQSETHPEYQMSLEPVRTGGKAKAYTFTCAGASGADSNSDTVRADEPAIDPALTASVDDTAEDRADIDIDSFSFPAIDASVFEEGASGLTDLLRMAPQTTSRGRRPYTKRQLPDTFSAQAQADAEAGPAGDAAAEPMAPRKLGRPRKVKKKPPVRKKAAAKNAETTEGADALDNTQDAPQASVQTPADASVDTLAELPASAPAETTQEVTKEGNGRTMTKRKAAQHVSYVALLGDDDFNTEHHAGRSAATGTAVRLGDGAWGDEHISLEGDRSRPGVYVGEPGSLNPTLHKKGRPRNSIVLIFRSDKLKNADFLPGWTDYPEAPKKATHAAKVVRKPRKKAQSIPTIPEPAQSLTVLATSDPVEKKITGGPGSQDDSVSITAQIAIGKQTTAGSFTSTEPNNTIAQVDPAAAAPALSSTNPDLNEDAPNREKKPRRTKGSKPTKWVCEKCGGAWLNDNGLEYHLKKGRNLCNPYFAEHPEELDAPKKHRQPLKNAVLAGFMPDLDCMGGNAQDGGGGVKPIIGPDGLPKQQRSKRKAAEKTVLALSENNSDFEQDDRPVLKQRALLQNKRLGPAVVPRGVQASEAVAKETATATLFDVPLVKVTTEEESQSVAPDQARTSTTPEDDDGDLPYLKQFQQTNDDYAANYKPKVLNATDLAKPVDVQTAAGSAIAEGMDYNADQSEQYPHLHTHTQIQEDSYPVEGLSTSQHLSATDNMTNGTPVLYNSPPESSPNGPVEAIATPPLANIRSDYPPPAQSLQEAQTSRHDELDMNGYPPFRMPVEEYTTDTHAGTIDKVLPLRTNRIQEIIKYLLEVNGVFPADTPLFWAVLKVYIATFEAPPYPSSSGCTRAVTILTNVGVIKQATVAIRPHGKWKSINLIMQPEIDVTHPLVIDLKDKIKDADSEMYIPPPFEPSEEERIHFQELDRPQKKRPKGSGRRDHKLAETVAELTAPYYAEQGIAGIRTGWRGRGRFESEDEDDEDERPRKRHKPGPLSTIRRRKTKYPHLDEETLALLSTAKRKRGRKPRIDYEDDFILEPHKLNMDEDYAENPGLWSLPPSFFSNTAGPSVSGNFPSTEIQFLAPNTQLDDDFVLEAELEAMPEGDVPTPRNEAEAEDVETAPQATEEATHSKTLVLRSNGKGVWPSIPLKWFEKNNFSFAMKGWLPGQVDMLMENLPQNMEQMAHRATSHYKIETWEDPQYGDFCTYVDGCRSWELSEQGTRHMSGSIVPNYVFINFSSTPEVSNMAPVQAQWLEKNEWTLETTPYDMLENYDAEPTLKFGVIPTAAAEPQKRGRPQTRPRPDPAASRQSTGGGRRSQRDPNLREVKVQRELTPYPQTPDEYFRAKGQECHGVDWKAEDTRIAAYVAVSTLTGGINKAMDWGLMMRIFPESKLSNLRKFWALIKKEREGFITTLFTKFQEEFLVAYENGNLPPFDFENPLNYDWLRLVKWTLALVAREGLELPASRKDFDEMLELINVNKTDLDWREMYHNWQRSVFNKFQDSTSEPASATLEPRGESMDNDAVIARSWVRALCCTDADEYTPYEIRDKFLALSRNGTRTAQEVSDLLEMTICDLEHRRVAVKQKTTALTAGRPYKLNEHFLHAIQRYSNEDKFTVAADFKLRMDAAFRQGEAVEIPWRTEDGMVMAAFNLQAHGRVRIEPIQRLEIPFGFRPGFYESRKFPKSYYRFGLQIIPTADYLYNEDIAVLQSALHPENIPTVTPDGKLPMWCDFFGRPDRDRWFRMLAGVMFVLATRGAMTDAFAAQALKPCFEEFEIGIVREWGLKQGLLAETTVPGGAATVLEWWWLVLGVAMLDPSDQREGVEDESAAAAQVGVASRTGNGDASSEGDRRRTKDQYAMWPSGRSRRRGNYRMV